MTFVYFILMESYNDDHKSKINKSNQNITENCKNFKKEGKKEKFDILGDILVNFLARS